MALLRQKFYRSRSIPRGVQPAVATELLRVDGGARERGAVGRGEEPHEHRGDGARRRGTGELAPVVADRDLVALGRDEARLDVERAYPAGGELGVQRRD